MTSDQKSTGLPGPFSGETPSRLFAFGLAFVIILYLGLDAGGYDVVVRSQTAIIVWWVLLLGLAFGYLPLAKTPKAGWLVAGALILLGIWGGIGAFTWSESTERGVVEVARISSLLGFYLLFLAVQGRDRAAWSVMGLGAAVAVIASISLTDRFEPGLMPFLESGSLPEGYPGARLRFPLDYWNGLAAIFAVGLPALLWMAAEARTIAGRVVSAGVIPLVGLALYMTFSRGGLIEAAVMLAALLVLYPRRLLMVASAIFPILGTALLIYLLGKRPEIRDFLPSEEAGSQGSEMFVFSLAVAFGSGLLRLVLDRAIESGLFRIPAAGPRVTGAVGLTAAAAVFILLVSGGVSGFFGDRWDDFRQVNIETSTSERLGSLSSSERYFLYDSALAAFQSEPAKGIGPGTFEYWWSREGEGQQFVRDAHSLYLESLAEMGVPGLILILILVLGPIIIATRRLLRDRLAENRALLAVSISGMVAFAVAAGVDWAWELTVLPAAFLLLAAVATGSEGRTDQSRDSEPEDGVAPSLNPYGRAGGAFLSLLAIAVIAIPMAGTMLVRDSQSEFRAGNEMAALDRAERAVSLEPWSASALVQEAQLLQVLNRPREAASVAREATRQEPGNWRNWLVLSETLQPLSPEASERASARALNLRARANRLSSEQGG